MKNKSPNDLKRLKAGGAHSPRDTGAASLRVLVCGPPGEGKTTLAEKLAEAGRRIENATQTAGLGMRFAGLLGSGALGALDEACQSFVTPNGAFTVCDASGQASDTAMLTAAASMADVAVIVIDAGNGLDHRAHYQALISSMLGAHQVVLAVNKLDVVDRAEARFNQLRDQFEEMAKLLQIEARAAIPIVAQTGENVVRCGDELSWYSGPALLEQLEAIEKPANAPERPFRLVIENPGRQGSEPAELAGIVSSGKVRRGDEIIVLPESATARVLQISTSDGEAEEAVAGDAVTVGLSNPIEAAVGDVLAAVDAEPSVSDQVAAHLIWLDREPLLPGRVYAIAVGMQTATATVSTLKHKVDADTLEHQAAATLEPGDVGYCNLSISRPVVFDAYAQNPDLGAFVLFDQITEAAVAIGTFEFGLWRATNVQWQALEVEKGARADLKGQRPCVLWFTGLSGAGKSTIASLLEKRLHALGRHTYVLDGDNVRHGLNKDLGFTDADRVENIRRVAETAKLFVDAGLIVMVSFISPFRMERRMARDLLNRDEFIEVFVDASLEVCEQRDPKGLYKKARAGEIRNFTGIDSAYEQPENADITLAAGDMSVDELVEQMMRELKQRALI